MAAENESLSELGEYLEGKLGAALQRWHVRLGELTLYVDAEQIVPVLKLLRDDGRCRFEILIDLCGVDWPGREKRFDVVYHLLSPRLNQRIRVKIEADEVNPVASAVDVFPTANWYEREAYDMYGILFAGHPDLRRILTDYGFEGHPFRKDFPLTGYIELRYSEEEKRVVYEPVDLPQDLRRFDFMSPWEGANYVLPGDEKAETPPVDEVKTTDKKSETGAGEKTNDKAAEKVAPAERSSGTVAGQGDANPAPVDTGEDEPDAPEPTENRPNRKPRKETARDTSGATEPDENGED